MGNHQSPSDRPRVHAPAWTPGQISQFWDNYQSIPHFQTRWFSLTCGPGIVDVASRYVPKAKVVLDYGCGRGDLTDLLLARGRRCMGVDGAPENVLGVQKRFAGRAGFLGAFQAPNPSLPAQPDLAFVVEVIEHMPRAAAADFLRGVGALLPGGGHILVSCPNQEDIVAAEVLCPECGCCFHPVQHLQSLAPADVAALASDAGFETVFAGATRFRRRRESRIYAWFLATMYGLFGRPPHLVFVGRKRSS
jgi:2-polyprenyl-3-methyl-5-hydroxy-6-metoxy-1,4-benzoquinol methylase